MEIFLAKKQSKHRELRVLEDQIYCRIEEINNTFRYLYGIFPRNIPLLSKHHFTQVHIEFETIKKLAVVRHIYEPGNLYN